MLELYLFNLPSGHQSVPLSIRTHLIYQHGIPQNSGFTLQEKSVEVSPIACYRPFQFSVEGLWNWSTSLTQKQCSLRMGCHPPTYNTDIKSKNFVLVLCHVLCAMYICMFPTGRLQGSRNQGGKQRWPYLPHHHTIVLNHPLRYLSISFHLTWSRALPMDLIETSLGLHHRSACLFNPISSQFFPQVLIPNNYPILQTPS